MLFRPTLFRRLALGLCFAAPLAFAQTADSVRLDLFFSPGCTECEQVKRCVLPELESRFEGFYELVWHDMTQSETIPLLVAYQQRCHNTENGRVSLVVDHTEFLSGFTAISTGLCDRVNEALINRQRPGWAPPAPPALEGARAKAVVSQRATTLTFSVVAVGGLLDGINPCAISTLIFFMSILTVAKAPPARACWSASRSSPPPSPSTPPSGSASSTPSARPRTSRSSKRSWRSPSASA